MHCNWVMTSPLNVHAVFWGLQVTVKLFVATSVAELYWIEGDHNRVEKKTKEGERIKLRKAPDNFELASWLSLFFDNHCYWNWWKPKHCFCMITTCPNIATGASVRHGMASASIDSRATCREFDGWDRWWWTRLAGWNELIFINYKWFAKFLNRKIVKSQACSLITNNHTFEALPIHDGSALECVQCVGEIAASTEGEHACSPDLLASIVLESITMITQIYQ